MTKEKLDNLPRLYITTQGQLVVISLEKKVTTASLIKIPGLSILIGPGVRPILERMLRTMAGMDVALALGMSTKRVSRLKRGLGIPMELRGGDRRTTGRRQRQKESE